MEKQPQKKAFKVVIIVGGPSDERNISLDSGRTCFDHIRKYQEISEVILLFVDRARNFYRLNSDFVYSNTIEDFEELFNDPGIYSPGEELEKEDIEEIIDDCDIFWPLIHGDFGEDGELAEQFEKAGRKAFVGSGSDVLALTLDKHRTLAFLRERGFSVPNQVKIPLEEWHKNQRLIERDIRLLLLPQSYRFIVKPNNCGSSDGVSKTDLFHLPRALQHAFAHTDTCLAEELISGTEFSIIILQNLAGDIVPLTPTEIEFTDRDDTVYSRRKKYLPGAGAIHRTPMRVSDDVLERVRSEAEQVFRALELRDWARFDGFVTEDDRIVWIDVNAIPGCGQDSFLFQQAALAGLKHGDIMRLMMTRALERETEELPARDLFTVDEEHGGEKLAVIGGGMNSERDVSRLSWSNVIQKVECLKHYDIQRIFLGKNGTYWRVPTFVALQHTIEEIEEVLNQSKDYHNAYLLAEAEVGRKFSGIYDDHHRINFLPEPVSLDAIVAECQNLFIALHGGFGENGELQAQLEALGATYNGSDPRVSAICADKHRCNQLVRSLEIDAVYCPEQLLWDLNEFRECLKRRGIGETEIIALKNTIHKGLRPKDNSYQVFKEVALSYTCDFQKKLGDCFVIKPTDDGCSTGILICKKPEEQLTPYLLFLLAGEARIMTSLLYPELDKNREDWVLLPSTIPNQLLLEEFIGTGDSSSDIIEITVGVLGIQGEIMSFLPSQTITEKDFLSLDEKFSKGVGPNLTPPPMLTPQQVTSIQHRVAQLSNGLGIRHYARIDLMYDITRDRLSLIEVNSLPGLTAATILYTQAILTPGVNLKPTEFLNQIITLQKA